MRIFEVFKDSREQACQKESVLGIGCLVEWTAMKRKLYFSFHTLSHTNLVFTLLLLF